MEDDDLDCCEEVALITESVEEFRDDYDQFEWLKVNCRELEVKFSTASVSAEELFDAYFRFLFCGLRLSPGYPDRYTQEAARVRRLLRLIDLRAYLDLFEKHILPKFGSKVERLKFKSQIEDVLKLIEEAGH